MPDRDGIFAGDNPFSIFDDWLRSAEKSEPNDPNAMSLATVDSDGSPDVRVVLLKGHDERGLVFFTNFESNKGMQLANTPAAAVNFHWKSLRRQVRFRGAIEKASAEESDAYYMSRPLGSRIGAWASQQSRPLESKEALANAVARATQEQGDTPSRPPFWGGFRLVPWSIEFWADGEFRQHDRFRWTRGKGSQGWTIQRLNP